MTAIATPTSHQQAHQHRNQLLEDIEMLELETKKALLQRAKHHAQNSQHNQHNSASAESFTRAYIMLATGKLPGGPAAGR
ncbi:hypothetical protein CS0771_26440 [Catellatospora sp. IY07-71]|uniref:hypothetical protein n=1 Tax=Catellatospora sp. IY07-71 TaxID=2728827 RepID=UPI001BB421AF|nr:hypothetical protein [Catellatospora sp. IY07-71]BCJ73100.1 hypothetical protein CS0771_26440 [Catellatospora sp. IY07-71]